MYLSTPELRGLTGRQKFLFHVSTTWMWWPRSQSMWGLTWPPCAPDQEHLLMHMDKRTSWFLSSGKIHYCRCTSEGKIKNFLIFPASCWWNALWSSAVLPDFEVGGVLQSQALLPCLLPHTDVQEARRKGSYSSCWRCFEKIHVGRCVAKSGDSCLSAKWWGMCVFRGSWCI